MNCYLLSTGGFLTPPPPFCFCFFCFFFCCFSFHGPTHLQVHWVVAYLFKLAVSYFFVCMYPPSITDTLKRRNNIMKGLLTSPTRGSVYVGWRGGGVRGCNPPPPLPPSKKEKKKKKGFQPKKKFYIIKHFNCSTLTVGVFFYQIFQFSLFEIGKYGAACLCVS